MSKLSETAVQTNIRVEASKHGWRVWRNNKGAGKLENGNFVRWGLCNDTATIGSQIRSADLIGIRPILITQAMVGQVIGQFISIECKPEGWKPRANDEHEIAQRRWADAINSMGGVAIFSTGAIDTIVNTLHTPNTKK